MNSFPVFLELELTLVILLLVVQLHLESLGESFITSLCLPEVFCLVYIFGGASESLCLQLLH